MTESCTTVFGDACIDRFVYGKCPRLCPEAPVPIFTPSFTEENDGMALNVANNIKSLGFNCVSVTNKKTQIVKERLVDDSTDQILLRIDYGDTASPVDWHSISPTAWDSRCAVVSDYDKGFLNEEDMTSIARRFPISFLDTKKPLGEWVLPFTFVKINESEYLKTKATVSKDIESRLLVTLGNRGCMFGGKIYNTPHKVIVSNVCGAGDTFLAGFVTKYIETVDIEDSIKFALYCAADVVGRRGVSVPFGESK
jgi:D-beta-D-heptose 7-phosphate kinase/D-beta-D-heptose 1-phosphate adenosyltransferase